MLGWLKTFWHFEKLADICYCYQDNLSLFMLPRVHKLINEGKDQNVL